MVTSELLNEMLHGKRPAFVLTCDGKIQHWKSGQGMGIVIATTRAAAEILATQFEKQQGKPVSISEMGKAQGDTLAKQIASSVGNAGADGVFVTEDGITNSYFKAPPVKDSA
jgi:hypothetical protein